MCSLCYRSCCLMGPGGPQGQSKGTQSWQVNAPHTHIHTHTEQTHLKMLITLHTQLLTCLSWTVTGHMFSLVRARLFHPSPHPRGNLPCTDWCCAAQVFTQCILTHLAVCSCHAVKPSKLQVFNFQFPMNSFHYKQWFCFLRRALAPLQSLGLCLSLRYHHGSHRSGSCRRKAQKG